MRLILTLTAFVVTTPVLAQSLESMQLATNLGTVLAAEEFCDLSYDQDAVAAYIADNVAADDMGFPSLLNTMTMGAGYNQQDMSASAKTAHCTQIGRLAQANGFID